MNEPDILYVAIFVFTMLLIGLGLTVWEFSHMKKTIHPIRKEDKAVRGLRPDAANNRPAKSSGS